jgi:type II secretory pathway pseudopilin PulG
MPSHTEQRGGFVLMEAIVAMAIIGMIAIGVLGASMMQVRTADKAGLLLNAAALAEERLAVVRALSYDELTQLPDSLAAGRFPPPFEAYEWHAEAAPIDDEYDLFSIGVVVTVGDEAFPLHTLVHQPQPNIAAPGPAAAPSGAPRVAAPPPDPAAPQRRN